MAKRALRYKEKKSKGAMCTGGLAARRARPLGLGHRPTDRAATETSTNILPVSSRTLVSAQVKSFVDHTSAWQPQYTPRLCRGLKYRFDNLLALLIEMRKDVLQLAACALLLPTGCGS